MLNQMAGSTLLLSPEELRDKAKKWQQLKTKRYADKRTFGFF